MHINKLKQNDAVSILMNTVKLRDISTMTGQLVGWESVMLDLLRCTLEMVTIEWNAKSTPSPTSISHFIWPQNSWKNLCIQPSSYNQRQLRIRKRGSIFMCSLPDFLQNNAQIEQIKIIQSTTWRCSIYTDLKTL